MGFQNPYLVSRQGGLFLSQHDAEDVRCIREVPVACSVSHVRDREGGRGAEAGAEGGQNRCAGRSYPFTGAQFAVYRHAPKKFGCGRSRNRKPAVGGFHIPASEGQGRGIQFLDAKVLETEGGSHNIDDGVQGTHFMEVDPAQFDAVYLCLRLGEPEKNLPGMLLDFGREGTSLEQPDNVGIVTVRLIFCDADTELCRPDAVTTGFFRGKSVSGKGDREPRQFLDEK